MGNGPTFITNALCGGLYVYVYAYTKWYVVPIIGDKITIIVCLALFPLNKSVSLSAKPSNRMLYMFCNIFGEFGNSKQKGNRIF